MKERMKAVCLISGGLDSVIATKLMIDQGFECIAVHFKSFFSAADRSDNPLSKMIAEKFNIEYKEILFDDDFVEVIKNPQHGHGQGLNPCINCKIYILEKTKKFMEEINAKFIVTGEVLGQRPMSQHKQALFTIEKKADLQGKILRPLSAGILPPTEAEQKGWVDRNKLLSISGRSRKMQYDLAKKMNITDFSSPAGGCYLTEKTFSMKLKDLFDNDNEITKENIFILSIGRHFRYKKNKIIVGRNESENNMLLELKSNGDLLFEASDITGPITILKGDANNSSIDFTAKLTAHYTRSKEQAVKIKYWNDDISGEVEVEPFSKVDIDKYNITLQKFDKSKLHSKG